MTYPGGGEMKFEASPGAQPVSLDEHTVPVALGDGKGDGKYPAAMISGLSEQTKIDFCIYLDEALQSVKADQLNKQSEWADLERDYRALSDPPKTKPYIGADTTVIPAIAMAVDPIHARLDTGIFKQDPVFQLKGLKKSFLPYIPALTSWIDYYQKHKLRLRRTASPRILECTKLGTCVFKTVYDRQAAPIMSYDPATWEPVKKVEVRFSGPNVYGIALGDFLFPPNYQYLEDCPFVFERIRTTFNKLKVMEASGKLMDVDKIKGYETHEKTDQEFALEDMANHKPTRLHQDQLIVWEAWCDYDIDGDGLPEHIVATYHEDTRTLLQLRYNWYFHQRKPYTVIPYTVTNGSLYGIGIAEMSRPFQKALTKWHQMATDNAYLANIRMFIVKKNSGIEEVPRLYSGRCFFVDDPKSDFIPFASGDIYPSTLSERQNLFGMVEKRTGVSDYLTGRESPIIGSRATATSTLALIQEGTKRVEEVLENFRAGFAEIIENCMYIWIQYGLDGLDDLVFGDDEIGKLLKEFFEKVSAENVNGALAIDLSATDAAGNRQALQQMQLQVIQVMMGYLEKVIALGQAALQPMQPPQFVEMAKDVMDAARAMFRDLLNKYDIRNADTYLPDLAAYLNGPQQSGPGAAQGVPGGLEGPAGQPQLPPSLGAFAGAGGPVPAAPGSGNGSGQANALAGLRQGIQG